MAKESLGKGLSALLSDVSVETLNRPMLQHLPVKDIFPHPEQPRLKVEPEELIDLAESIREHGIIEPLIVTKEHDDHYTLIAGERRWRAAKLAGLESVPAVVREASPQQMLELAVIENVQRSDLSPIEEAMAYRMLAAKYGLTHEQIARKTGMSRVAITNKIRLLKLPVEVKQALLNKQINEGHAKALLSLTDEAACITAMRLVIKHELTARQAEELVRRLSSNDEKKTAKRRTRLNQELLKVEERLGKYLKAPVIIQKLRKGGKIVIRYSSDKKLQDVLKVLKMPY